MTEFITTERRGNVFIVTMNRPEVYNAVHPPMHHEMHGAWEEYAADDSLWCAILTGAGEKAFSAGNDLKYTASGGKMKGPDSGFAGLTSNFTREKPIIAAVNGFAMGGGFETAMACDILIAAENATFALPEVKVGFFAAAGGVQMLTRFVPRKIANEMILTGRHISAAEAKEIGIVNAVVPQSGLMDAAMAKAAEITSVSPSAIKASKRVLNALDTEHSFAESIEYSREVIMDLRHTDDFKEGVTAFVEKRAPKWVGH
ncbi:enoyl-CoA hydratase-related protein [Chachezhania sediminis]|uniref:enoyl-CoA hydratase-related protein n=1 Tax=Chachezhania sediminis TaxID=2599291 RepID=UPI00131E16DA|nr:enoyl-CoA hydratase-related protein [Chachezhania sediminis]